MSKPRWVLIEKAADLTGYTEHAIRHKIKDGTWAEGRIWKKAKGRIHINLEEYDKWVESAPMAA